MWWGIIIIIGYHHRHPSSSSLAVAADTTPHTHQWHSMAYAAHCDATVVVAASGQGSTSWKGDGLQSIM